MSKKQQVQQWLDSHQGADIQALYEAFPVLNRKTLRAYLSEWKSQRGEAPSQQGKALEAGQVDWLKKNQPQLEKLLSDRLTLGRVHEIDFTGAKDCTFLLSEEARKVLSDTAKTGPFRGVSTYKKINLGIILLLGS